MTHTTNHLAIALTLLALVAVAPKTAVAAEGYYLQRNLITNDEPWKVEDRGEEPAIAVL